MFFALKGRLKRRQNILIFLSDFLLIKKLKNNVEKRGDFLYTNSRVLVSSCLFTAAFTSYKGLAYL